MIETSAHLFSAIRNSVHSSVKDLTNEQWLMQPAGFANNIAWNVGHVLVAQSGLVYRRCGVASTLPKALVPMYKPGSSPADWESTPDIPQLLDLLLGQADQLEADVKAGKFEGTEVIEWTSGGGFSATTAGDYMAYNNYHEGLHQGNIVSLLDMVTAS